MYKRLAVMDRLFAFVGWKFVSPTSARCVRPRLCLFECKSNKGREVAKGYEGAGGGRVAGLPTRAVIFSTVVGRP